jgi:predicted permease
VGVKNGDPTALKVYEAWRIAPALRPLRDSIVGNMGTILWVVMGTLGIVMLIAAANVANLLLVRAAARHQELGVRAALGAGWGRNAGELLSESMLLTCAGGALGTALAYGGLRLLVQFGPASLPRLSEISLDLRALAFAVGTALASGLLLGLIPALKYAATGIPAALRGEGRGSSASREHNRMRSILVVAQVSLALVLLIGSVLMVRTFQALRRVDPGFTRPGQLQTFYMTIPNALMPSPEVVTRTENAIVDKLRAIPGVTSAGFASALPMDGTAPNWDGMFREGQDYVPGEPMTMRLFVNTSPGFLPAAGTRVVAGRDFAWGDVYQIRPYVLISDNLAREWWGSASAAVGKRIREGPLSPWQEVIGVVADVRNNGVHEPAPATVYWPAMSRVPYAPDIITPTRTAAFVVRSDQAGTAGLLDEVQRAVWSVNAALPVAETQTMQTIYDRSLARTSFTLVMLAIAGTMALVLGIVGIYGVIAYAVSQRSREIGIRSALGARPGELKEMFVRNALTLAGVGVVIGLSAAAGLTRLMKSLLFGISPLDPVTYAAVPIVLIAAAAMASYVPARRAAMVDPINTLRAE